MFTRNYEPRVLNVNSHHVQQKLSLKRVHRNTSILTNGPYTLVIFLFVFLLFNDVHMPVHSYLFVGTLYVH
jgi:hypothetical protein